jgi:hypothetical protein
MAARAATLRSARATRSIFKASRINWRFDRARIPINGRGHTYYVIVTRPGDGAFPFSWEIQRRREAMGVNFTIPPPQNGEQISWSEGGPMKERDLPNSP